MKLINFSITNFRSITKAHKINVGNTTILLGKNNEGKSNILKGLQIAMDILRDYRLERPRFYRRSSGDYQWDRDFPIHLQRRRGNKESVFRLEFELSESELESFKTELNIKLNGILPLEIRINPENQPSISIIKSGKRNEKTIDKKVKQIVAFLSNKIYFNYIPAVRTEQHIIENIDRMLYESLRVLENDDKYIEAIETISNLRKPILDSLAEELQEPLREFLPSINKVSIEANEINRRLSSIRNLNIIIDDGYPTLLDYKGDGVKSLIALGLLKNLKSNCDTSIIAIEEPESHLHPGAIHQLNDIIQNIDPRNQLIITTHNPLFVNRGNIKSNIIVNKGKANQAKNITEIRNILGVKASDNLINASFILIVEGDEDRIALNKILSTLSPVINKALKDKLFVIEPLGGAGNLSYKLSHLKSSLCNVYVFLDYDDAGRKAYQDAKRDNLIRDNEISFSICKGRKPNSEFEDCINEEVYKKAILDEFGVDITSTAFRGSEKWSVRIIRTFKEQGKIADIKDIKYCVANAISNASKDHLHEHNGTSIKALAGSLERTINSIKL